MFTKNNRLCRYWQQCNYHNPFSPDCSRSVHHTTYNQPKREAKKKAMKESASPDREKEKQIFTWLLILCTSLTLCPSISWSGFGANSTSWPVDINYHFIILSAPFTVYFPFSPWVKGPSPFDWRAHRQWERWRECTWRRRCGGRRGEPPNSPEKV